MARLAKETPCGIIFWLTRGGRRQRCTFYAQAAAAAMKKPKSAGLLLQPSGGAPIASCDRLRLMIPVRCARSDLTR
jgi:hypothetical protein